ncbi:MAG: ferredoxin [Candidatus Diapherotrites archaeon]|nr:ferredoxin [Candidatus Diapherotrites archaeon]
MIQKHEECIGCGACTAICPDHWEMGDDGKSFLKGAKKDGDKLVKEVNDAECNQDAADSCPVPCIFVEK